MSKEMALILINEKGMSMMQALDAIYNSDTYSSLINLKSGLYSQSTAYVYEYLNTWIKNYPLALCADIFVVFNVFYVI